MVSEKEYRRKKIAGQHQSLRHHTFTGRLTDKDPVFSRVETAQGIPDRWMKFVVEYRSREDGVTKRILQDCFIDRGITSLRKKLESLSPGDVITVRGRWRVVEDKQRTRRGELEIESRMAATIFAVDRIE